MKQFLLKIWTGLLTIIDYILTFIISLIGGALLWAQITIIGLIVYLFGGLNSLTRFYKALGTGSVKYSIFKDKFNQN